MDALMTFIPAETKEAEMIAERIIVQLQHGNSAVILTTIKVLLYLMNYMENRKLIEYICKKMGPPLGEASLKDTKHVADMLMLCSQ